MSSNSSPTPSQQPHHLPAGSQSADTDSSPFRALLESPLTLPSVTKQRSPRTPSYVGAAHSPQPPPRPSSVLPRLLGALSPAPPTSASTATTATTVKTARSPSPTNSRRSTSASPAQHPSGSPTRPCSPPCAAPSPPSAHSSNASASAAAPQQFCLRWNNYQSNLTSVFDQLLQNESFVDVTLACDGRSIKAHKMVLSACSPYFQTLLSDTPCQHPIIIMRDVNWLELKAIVEFMYKGEINVSQEQIGPLLRIAEMLKVRGLADVSGAAAAGGIGVNLEHESRSRAPKVDPKERTTAASPQRRSSFSSPELLSKLIIDDRKTASERLAHDRFLSFIEPEKKLRFSRPEWDTDNNTLNSSNSNLEMRLSPQMLPHNHQQQKQEQLQQQQQQQQQQQVGRNVRKRRWPSTETIFNTPGSPLSGLIAAERAERERERERDHERERERERLLVTPPIPSTSSAAGHANSARSTPATQEVDVPLDAPTRAQSAALVSSPHMHQQQHASSQHHQQQHLAAHHSHHSSPASSTTSSTANPDPATGLGAAAASHGDGRYPLGHAQAAAMAAAAAAAQMDSMGLSGLGLSHLHPSAPPPPAPPTHRPPSIVDDMEIKPGIAEMIREEERAKMLENSHSWMGATTSSIAADSYQYQLQSMWQKCWNTNQNLMHNLRFRERGPLKSWRPETMAEAIFSVLKEGLSLSQAARKYDIPYPTFVLYANRVHNMLGPSIDGGPDLRPKGRGRPQRILLGIWPDEHIKGVIKTVVFREAKDLKDEGLTHLPYGRHSPVFPFQEGHLNYPGVSGPCPNGMPTPTGDQMSQEATAAAVAAVAHNLRQQMQIAAAAQHHQHQQQQHQHQHGECPPGANIFNLPPHLQPHLSAAAATGGVAAGSSPHPGPKSNISPASGSGANPAAAMLAARHARSPCGTGLPNLPPSMAAALHMAGAPMAREAAGPTAAMLGQHQHQQLQQLQLQQQHALHQQQQLHHQQHSPAHLAHFQASAAAATAAASLQRHQQSSGASAHPLRTTSPTASSTKHHKPAPHGEHRRGDSPPLTDMGLDASVPVGISGMTYMKPSRGYSSPRPEHLFQEDIADLVAPCGSSGAAITSGNSTAAANPSSVTSAVDASSGGIKIEPMAMSLE